MTMKVANVRVFSFVVRTMTYMPLNTVNTGYL